MNNFRQILMKSPEFYLMLIVILSGYTPPFSINPIAIGLLVIVILQLVFRNKISGLVIASLFLLANIVMIGALISELNEFQTFDAGAKKLLLGGGLILGFNLFVSGLMFFKYSIPIESAELKTQSGS